MSYLGHSLGVGSYSSADMQLVYSTAPVDWAEVIDLNYSKLLVQGVKCSPMVRETWIQYQVASYRRLLKWYLILPYLTLSNIRYLSRAKWSNPGKEVAPSLHLGVVAIKKGAFWSPSTTVASFYL